MLFLDVLDLSVMSLAAQCYVNHPLLQQKLSNESFPLSFYLLLYQGM
jgi:hypothetical protein